MRAKIYENESNTDTNYQIWKNPVDNVLYGSYSEPKNGFAEAGAWPIYNLNQHQSNYRWLFCYHISFSDNLKNH